MAHSTPGEFARVFQSVKRPKGDCDLHEMKEKVQNVSEVASMERKRRRLCTQTNMWKKYELWLQLGLQEKSLQRKQPLLPVAVLPGLGLHLVSLPVQLENVERALSI